MKTKRCKRIFCLFLSFLLFFTGEVPAYAEGISGIKARFEEERVRQEEETLRLEKEAAIFAVQEGITLSGNFPEEEENFTETETSGDKEAEWEDWDGVADEKETDGTAALRQPETDAYLLEEAYGELVEVGEYYKTYRLFDGTYKTLFTAYANTYEENGEEKPIDNTLISGNGTEEGTYTNKENDIDVTFYGEESGEAALSVSAEGMEAVLKPVEGDYGKAAVSENAIRYNGVFENTDMQYTVEPDGVKQDIILLAPQDKTSFTYRLKKDGVLARLEDNSICLYKRTDDSISHNTVSENAVSKNAVDEKITSESGVSGNSIDSSPLMVISAPGMEDAAGAFSADITIELSETQGDWLITIRADEEWLEAPERVYPVKIDPSTIVLKNEIHNYTIASQVGAMPNQPCSHAGYIDGLGKARSYVITDFLYESILFGQKDVEILSATLNIYQLNDVSGFWIGCYRLGDHLPYWNQVWDNTITIDRYIAGEDAVKPAGQGWHSFDIRETINGWTRDVNIKSNGLVLVSSNESAAGAVFATDSYPDPAFAPTLEIVWQPAGDVPFNYPLDDTTVNLRPMVQTTVSGKMQCYGVFADGIATPGAYVAYALSDAAKGYTGAMLTGNSKLYPDSRSFQSLFPAGTLGYYDRLSNWQSAAPFTWYDMDTVYRINARSSTAEKLGKTVSSEPFLIYRVTRYDTMQKIADYYGVPLNTILFDNKAADMLLVENNTLFIRNPSRNQNTPYQPSDLTDEEKVAIDTALLGRARHCEFGFEPINLNTGNFYLVQEDFSYGDILGAFALQRSYNALNSRRIGSFGRGFTSFLDESISALSDGTLVYNREDGSSISFVPDGKGGYKAPEGDSLKLMREACGTASAEFSDGIRNYTLYRYIITMEDGSTRTFDAGGDLIQIRGEKGDTLIIQRNTAGQLTGLIREGVAMPVTTTPEGLIATVTLPGGGVFRYTYDSRQNLSAVTNPLGGTKRFTYDNNHRMTAWYDENGTRIVQNTYDSKGRVVRQLDENGGVITLAYGNGLTVATDARGNKTAYEYDGESRTTAIRYPDGTSIEREYLDGQMVKETDRAGVETAYTYDAMGNTTKKTMGNVQNIYVYDEAGRLIECTDPLGGVTRSEYDGRGNLIKLTDPEGNITTFTYDGKNRLSGKTDGNGNKITYTYHGNCLSEIRINGRITDKLTHNAMGQVISHADGEGNTTVYAYDAMGRTTAIKDPEGNTTAIAYTKNGLIQSVTDGGGGKTVYTYDKANNVTAITDAGGNRYEYAYDAGGNRIFERDSEGNATEYIYDEMDRPVKIIDAMGNTYLYAYDAHDNPISVTDPLGGTQSSVYDDCYGQLLTYVDEEGIKTAYTYDAYGNLLSITRDEIPVAAYTYDGNGQCILATLAGGTTWRMKYDGNGNCILRTDEKGRTLAFTYDEENRLIKEITASGAEYGYAYDKAGNLTEVTCPDGSKNIYHYDKNGNILTWIDGEGNTTSYTYDATANLTEEILPDGTKKRYVYDSLGRLTLSADGRGYVTAYQYDKTGNLTEVTDALGQTVSYGWDSLGRNTEITDTMGRKTAYTYDGAGNLLTETAPDGGVTTYAYDKTGRPVKVTDPLSSSTLYEYDAFGRLIKETDATGASICYAYDLAGNLTEVTDALNGKTAFEYDPYGNLISETDAGGNRTAYTYDAEDRLTEIKDAIGSRTVLSYDAMGNLIQVTDPVKAVWNYAYDKAGKLLTETAPDGGSRTYTYDAVGNLIQTADSLRRITGYSYDAAGNLTEVTEPSGAKVSYEYDALCRRISTVHEVGTEDLYAYDPAGNLIYTKEGGQRLTAYTYDEMNRLVSVEDALGSKTVYAYDLCGRLISERAPDTTETAYAYDAAGHLTEMTLADGGVYRYAYDKTGRLTKASNPTGMETLYEYDAVGNITALTKGTEQKTSYSYDSLNRLTETVDALGGRTAYTYDRTGNLTGITYADGTTARYEYDKTGRLTGTTNQAGLYTAFCYDTEGQLLSETAGAGREDARTYTYSYDKNGNLIGTTNPLEQTTAYSYDIRNRLLRTVTPGGSATAYEYDSLSNLRAVTDAEGARTTYAYDAKGRLTEENLGGEEKYAYAYDACDRLVAAEGENSLITYAYGRTGNLSAVTGGNGETTAYAYDPAGNLTGTTDPLGSITENTYDKVGRLSVHRDENGTATTYAYDALNRLIKKDAGETLSAAAYEYDAMGRLTRMEDVTGESAYAYDEAGRLLTAVDGNGRKVSYTYDIYGNTTSVTYPDGGKATYTYDALNRMTGVTDSEGKTTRYEYDRDGNLTKVLRENGETDILYDSLGQVTALANMENGALISAYAYAYDKRGNITREESRILKEGKQEETVSTYAYDGKSQLIRAKQTVAGEETAVTEYTYDPAGNRLEMQTRKGKETLTVTYTYDEGGRLLKKEDSQGSSVSYEYDRAGNLTVEKATDADGAPSERHYLYDASDRLSAVTDKDTLLLAALYDGNGNRTFVMEYMPQLKSGGSSAGKAEKDDNGRSRGTGKSTAVGEAVSGNGITEDTPDNGGNGTEAMEDDPAPEDTPENMGGSGAFWYGVLCQLADILLPAPTPFKAWLHEKMELTDDVTVLWTEEIHEAEPGESTLTVQEAGDAFALVESIFADAGGKPLEADAYRQVNYVNDISYGNTQTLMEYAINGGKGESRSAYTYGLYRESCTIAMPMPSAGNAYEVPAAASNGTYYYTGTGSVANLTGNGTGQSYSYGLNGETSVYGMYGSGAAGTGVPGAETGIPVTGGMLGISGTPGIGGTCASYAYNGEYTHEALGLQYLRARYYNMATGTFISRDTYGGSIRDILSQNRYTYARNNPVTYADPSGHISIKGAWNAVKAGARTAANAAKAVTSAVTKAVRTGASAVSSVVKGAISKPTVKLGNINKASGGTASAYAKVSGAARNQAARNKAAKSAARADLIGQPLTMCEAAAAWADWGAEKAAGYMDESLWRPGLMIGAYEVQAVECFAYSQLENSVHLIIPEADVARMLKGAGLMLGGAFKSFGGFMLAAGGMAAAASGIGVMGIGAGTFVVGAGASDMNQGAEEFFLGMSGDSTTRTSNGMSDLFYDGNDEIYHLSTGTAAAAGSMLTPFVNAAYGKTAVTGTAAAGSAAEKPSVTVESVAEKPTVTEAAGGTTDDALEQFYDDIFESSYREQFDPVGEQAIAGTGELESGSVAIDPQKIRYSQSSVTGSNEIIESMQQNGWKGNPIDVVKMPDGVYTTIDNTRVVAAREVGINVEATVHNYNDLLPIEYIDRFTTKKGIPTTWGEAIELRIGKQNASFRNANPFGAFDMEKIK